MAILSDCHLHSSFSGDSDAPMEQMILKGIDLGLASMCFTEHMDMDFVCMDSDEENVCFEVNTDAYRYDLLRFREKYEKQLRMGFGIELGIQPHLTEKLNAYTKSYDFDFVIASSHLSNRMDPYQPSFYKNRTEEEAYYEYFSSLLEAINSFHDFDVYGHLDYVVRYGPNKDREYSYDKYKDILDKILHALIDMGKGIEINTGAVNYKLKEMNPCTGILKRYKELGGEIITAGSDAHRPDAICSGFDKAAEILSSCGFKYYTTFEKRTASFHRI